MKQMMAGPGILTWLKPCGGQRNTWAVAKLKETLAGVKHAIGKYVDTSSLGIVKWVQEEIGNNYYFKMKVDAALRAQRMVAMLNDG